MRRKYLQLVHHDLLDEYAIYEAILDTDTNFPIWISDTPNKGCVFDSYKEAIWQWSVRDKKYSCIMDILDNDQFNELKDEKQEKELIF